MPHILIGRDAADLAKFGDLAGTAYIGRHIVGEKKEAHMANPVRMDISRPHVISIFGKRGSGKSYSLAVIAEELMNAPREVKNNVTVLIIDTMGIYWSMKYPNEKESRLLAKWDLKPKSLEMDLYIPEGQAQRFRRDGIPYDKTLTLNPGELESSSWASAFNIMPNELLGILLNRAVRAAKRKFGESYDIGDIIEEIRSIPGFDSTIKEALVNRFLTAEDWGIFSKNATDINKLLAGGKVSVLDVSLYGEISGGWSVRALIVGLLAKRILAERMRARRLEEIEEMEGEIKKEMPIVWMIMDEAHNFVPSVGDSPSLKPVLDWAKLGRQPGVSMVLATQMPAKLHEEIIAQSDIIISHRLTAQSDINALRNTMQTYMRYDLAQYIDNLPRFPGAAICLDDNSERLYKIQIRPRFSWHGGATPTVLKKKEEFL